jgi:quinol monooxygenase YgiN
MQRPKDERLDNSKREQHTNMIHVIATIELAPGKREPFLDAFRANVPLVLREDGCIEYGPTEDVVTDIAAQIPKRENVVTVVEKWRDLAALKAHLVAPHMLTYRTKVKDFVQRVSLQVLQPV